MNQQECVERKLNGPCFSSFVVVTGQRRYKEGQSSSRIFLFSINNTLKIILLSPPPFDSELWREDSEE